MEWLRKIGARMDTSSDVDSILGHMKTCTTPEQVWGKMAGKADEQISTLTKTYRRIAKKCHPDLYAGSALEKKASDAFAMLTEWKDKAEAKIRAGTYGDNKPYVAPTPPPVVHPQTIKTAKTEYNVTKLLFTGDLADLYACTFKLDGKDVEAVLKVTQSPADNDLLENESKSLVEIHPTKPTDPARVFYKLLPTYYDSFLLRGASRTNRRVVVMERIRDHFSLAEVMKEYPKGLDFRDAVWMFKRCLMALGFVHKEKKVVHGALVPTHVLVDPIGHGAKLVDWCYSVRQWDRATEHVKALSSPYKAFYAPETLAKKPPTPQTDLYMLAKCMIAVLGGDVATNQVPSTVPKPIQSFFGSCLLAAQHRRPDDAWRLHEEFDELLKRLVGKPTYRPLFMPPRT